MSERFQREYAAWARLKPFLPERQVFGVVKDDGVVALFEDPIDAMQDGTKRFGAQNFLLMSSRPVPFPLRPGARL